MENKHADIVIVGVGAAGAILARELTEAGFTVLGIDKGPYYHSDDFWTKFDELRYSSRAGLSPTMDTDPMTWRPDAQTPAQILPWAVGPQPKNPLCTLPRSASAAVLYTGPAGRGANCARTSASGRIGSSVTAKRSCRRVPK